MPTGHVRGCSGPGGVDGRHRKLVLAFGRGRRFLLNNGHSGHPITDLNRVTLGENLPHERGHFLTVTLCAKIA